MGPLSWLRRRRMQDPVVGTFTVVSSYFPHPGRTPMQTMLTGYVDGPGIARTAGEALQHRDRDQTERVLPATIDRAEPSNFRIEWSRVPKFDGGSAAARAAARRAAGQQP